LFCFSREEKLFKVSKFFLINLLSLSEKSPSILLGKLALFILGTQFFKLPNSLSSTLVNLASTGPLLPTICIFFIGD